MQHDRPQSSFDRDGILRVLWADPMLISSDGVRGTPPRLDRGDEYLDLQRLAAGVQVAARGMSPTGGELSRKAVAALTWGKLLAYLDLRS